jgi:hypothetical protein
MNLDSTVDMMGNVSSDIGILIMVGENASLTPVEQGLLYAVSGLVMLMHPCSYLGAVP